MTSEATGFLYPFIEAEETDTSDLLADLAASAQGKWAQSVRLAADTLAADAHVLARAAAEMAERFEAGGQLLAFGNGGSSTDADALVELFTSPPHGSPLPARSLASDSAVITALANDIGVESVFARQLMAHGRPGDVAVALSTSGNSENLIVALGEAKRRGMLTVGLAGYDGGRMATCPDLDHCLVARSESVHRVQEAQAVVAGALWARVQSHLRAEEAS